LRRTKVVPIFGATLCMYLYCRYEATTTTKWTSISIAYLIITFSDVNITVAY